MNLRTIEMSKSTSLNNNILIKKAKRGIKNAAVKYKQLGNLKLKTLHRRIKLQAILHLKHHCADQL